MKEMVKRERGSGVKNDRTLDSIGNRYKLCFVGDLNLWIGDRTRAGKTGTFGVLGENDNSRRVVEFCSERELSMGNTF